MVVNISLNIPDWLVKPFVLLVLLYRRLRYGYAFRLIPLTQGKFAIVDHDDYEWLNAHKWQAHGYGRNIYARRTATVKGKRVLCLMHREVVKTTDDMVVDHINHNSLDNRKANLRPCTFIQNTWNRKPHPHSGRFTGVTWHKRQKKWVARIHHADKLINLGSFDDEVEAARAYDAAAKKFRGEFAVLNFGE